MQRMRLAMAWLLFLAVTVFGTCANADDVYVQDFNGNWPYDGWTDYNPDHGEKFEWESLKSMTCEGSGAIAHTSEDYTARAWVASPGLDLISTNTYICSFQQRVGNANFPEKMATYIWNGAPRDFNPQDASAILIWKDDHVTNTTCSTPSKTFAVSATGQDYHVVFYCTSDAKEYLAIWDDLLLRTTSALTVSTADITNVTSTTARSGGNVTSDGGATVTARGVCWSTNPNPTTADSHTTDGSGTGVFTSDISGLSPGTQYHVRAYATNANGTAYGSDRTFTSGSMVPTVSTTPASHITSTTAQSGGNVTSDGGATVTARGVCWGLNPNPTTADSHTTDGSGTGAFTSSITGLTPGATYHVRAYATNVNGTAYGEDLTFTEGSVPPSVTTKATTHITATTAQSGGDVTSDGGATVTTKGVCWGLNPNPTTADSHTSDGSGTGAFTSSITGLTPGATYHVRAYASNANGTAYGSDKTFTSCSVAPTVSTTPATHITSTTAQSGGNVTSDGGATVTARGVCWGLNPDPTISNSHTADGSGTGVFTSSITGLTPGATYHVRAYAINANGTAYGRDLAFTEGSVIPTVSTADITNITSTTAQSGGNVTSDGGATVTARGVCWSLNPNPTTADSHTADGSGTGVFTSDITGLTPGATYHVRAYAINANGTAYGSDKTFTSGSLAPTVSTTPPTHITSTTAQGGGDVTSDGGAAVTARGVCWDLNPNPTIADSHTADGSGTGVFTSDITGLTPGATYHVRAYATNNHGTAYGRDLAFTEGSVAPTVSTTSASHITATTAQSGGNVTSDGGASVTTRGVCWSINPNPTITDSHTVDGDGTGFFSSALSELTAETHYHIRAYATNSAGAGYGEDIDFATSAPAPTIDGFTPSSGGQGTSVAITGTSFSGVNAVRFGGTDAEDFQVDSDTRITALVGNGSSGHITVISTRGTATSAKEFTYLPTPIPTLNTWGFIGISLLVAGIGYFTLRKHYVT